MGGDVVRRQTQVNPRGQGGFTLIELLIVTSILTILTGVVVFAVGRARENASRNACETERLTFENASNASQVDQNDDIRNYLKTDAGLYFEASGSTGYVPVAGSGYTADCAEI